MEVEGRPDMVYEYLPFKSKGPFLKNQKVNISFAVMRYKARLHARMTCGRNAGSQLVLLLRGDVTPELTDHPRTRKEVEYRDYVVPVSYSSPLDLMH
jgi:hypothetical protein